MYFSNLVGDTVTHVWACITYPQKKIRIKKQQTNAWTNKWSTIRQHNKRKIAFVLLPPSIENLCLSNFASSTVPQFFFSIRRFAKLTMALYLQKLWLFIYDWWILHASITLPPFAPLTLSLHIHIANTDSSIRHIQNTSAFVYLVWAQAQKYNHK